MLGIDLTKISRFKSPNRKLIERVLHPNELKEYESVTDKAKFLAQRWSIKEALFKADNKYFHFNKVELKEIDRVFKLPGFTITTTTEDDYYMAVVMKEGKHESKN